MPRPHALAVVVCSLGISAFAPAIGVAQATQAAQPAQSTPPAAASSARKSPRVAALVGFVLPGAGHVYAGEGGRGLLIAAAYWTGVAIVHGGRTDAAGKVGGVLVIAALGTSVIDGAAAARRHDARLAVGLGRLSPDQPAVCKIAPTDVPVGRPLPLEVPWPTRAPSCRR